MSLIKHIPSHVMVAGYRTLIPYEGQPITCYSFNEPGHLQTACLHRRREWMESSPGTTASWVEVAARVPISNTTTILDRATDIAEPKNMEAEILQATVSARTPQKDELGQRGVEAAPEMEERVLEPTTVTADERPQVEGRRRTLSNDHALPFWEGLRDRMETPQEQQPARRQPGKEESGRPIRDKLDMEGVILEWCTGGKEGRLAPETGCKRQLRQPCTKGPKSEGN